jgi:thiol-disulfide isomerase/thioredoxin
MNWNAPRATALDLSALESAIAQMRGGPVLIHHFATWCEPCEEELPLLAGLLQRCGKDVRRVAIAWDLFLARVRPEEAVEACAEFLSRHGATFDDLFVYTGVPDALFESQRIEGGTVPFTELRDAKGERTLCFPGPLFDEADRIALGDALAESAKARD